VVETRDHWFSFGAGSLAVSESHPQSGAEVGHFEGQNHTLFFLHGRFGDSEIWRALVSRLASRFRCLRVDLPGFGRSLSPTGCTLSLHDHSQLIQELVLRFLPAREKAILVGHDVGGAIAQLCALQSPERVAALVLINSASLTHAPKSLSTGLFGFQARRELGRICGMASSRLSAEHRCRLREVWRNRLSRSGMVRAFENWEYTWPGPAERKVWGQQLARLPQPVLLLWGLKDPIHSIESAGELLRQFSDAYLFEDEECGHWPSLESQEWVDSKMREFLFRLHENPPSHRAA
jgi:pimeloyl-ACP methyl ester carboxylesterase